MGDCYPESWYDHLPNEVADPLRQITQWTKEDIKKLQLFLEDREIIVRRPVFENIDDHINENDNLSKPPITPRDNYLALGNTLYSLHRFSKKDPWQHIMDIYKEKNLNVISPENQPINCVSPPSLVRIGKDLYIDKDTHENVWGFVCEWIIEASKEYRINICQTAGHSDGVFCPIAPGILVTTHYKYDYSQTFPDWEIFRIPQRYNNFNQFKNWSTPDEKINNNQAFSNHVLNKAREWVGDFKETVYEVNMLVIDEKNVVAMKEYEPLTKWLEQKGINVHFFDFRTRSFWDGGWHCLTLDICREDSKIDLFPDRGANGVYWKIN